MEVAALVASLVLGVAGGMIIIGNWHIFVVGIRGGNAPSWVPLLGGVAASLSCWLAPSPWLNENSLLPLLLDWGSLPGLGHTLFYWLFLRSGESDTEQTLRRSRTAAYVIVVCSIGLAVTRLMLSIDEFRETHVLSGDY